MVRFPLKTHCSVKLLQKRSMNDHSLHLKVKRKKGMSTMEKVTPALEGYLELRILEHLKGTCWIHRPLVNSLTVMIVRIDGIPCADVLSIKLFPSAV